MKKTSKIFDKKLSQTNNGHKIDKLSKALESLNLSQLQYKRVTEIQNNATKDATKTFVSNRTTLRRKALIDLTNSPAQNLQENESNTNYVIDLT